MAAQLRILEKLIQYEYYVLQHGESEDPWVQESIGGMAKEVVEELRRLRPILETPNFQHLLDFHEYL